MNNPDPETPLSAADSLRLIEQMIHTAKRELGDNSFDILLWGWLVLAAALLHYGLLRAGFGLPWLSWVVLMPVGGVVSFVRGLKQQRRVRVRTAPTDFLPYLWGGFTVLLLMLLGVGAVRGWQLAYPLVIGLYGVGTFATGGALRFRPLLWGGAACWVLATVAFRVAFEGQLLLIAAAVLVAYVVPGHLLRKQYTKERHERTI